MVNKIRFLDILLHYMGIFVEINFTSYIVTYKLLCNVWMCSSDFAQLCEIWNPLTAVCIGFSGGFSFSPSALQTQWTEQLDQYSELWAPPLQSEEESTNLIIP